MTKHDNSPIDSGDRPLHEIEITPEMIEAGVRCLWASGRWSRESPAPDSLFLRELLHRVLEGSASEKSATLVCDALNDEAARVDGAVKTAYRTGLDFERARNQVVPGPDHNPGILAMADPCSQVANNGQDKETT